jgi:hypothetical protein
VPGAAANPQERRCQVRPECGLAAERHDFHCSEAARRGCLLVADGGPREDAAEWLLRLGKASLNLQGQLSAALPPIRGAVAIPARDPDPSATIPD